MKKKKILQMFVANAKGGRTQYMLNNWQYINRNKFQFDFATLSSHLDFAEQLEKEGCKIHYISCYAEDNLQKFVSEIDQVLTQGYDAVHIHFSFWRSFTIEERARKAGIKKTILHAHNFGVGGVGTLEEAKILTNKHYELREKLSANIADYYLACSKEAAEWMYGGRIDYDKIRILRNGIDIEKFKYNKKLRTEVRKALGIQDKFVIGNVGRFVYQKNHEFLIDIFGQICKQIENIVLILIGAGELQKKVESRTKELGIYEKVYFLGKRDDVEKLMQGMDLFVLPSRFDGFPLSLLEAQAAGLPCVASNVPVNASLSTRTKIIELEQKQWIQCIKEEYNRKERCQLNDELLELHDIRKQVKELEEIYS